MRERISSFILIVSVILTVVFFVSLFLKPLFYFFRLVIPRIQTQSHSHLFLFLLCYLVMFQFFLFFLHNYLHLSRTLKIFLSD